MASRNERLIENQQNFRYANERLESLADDVISRDRIVPFLCECADDGCLGRVEMDMDEYDAIHVDSELYVILRAHPLADGEQVVEERDGFDVVRKSAEVG